MKAFTSDINGLDLGLDGLDGLGDLDGLDGIDGLDLGLYLGLYSLVIGLASFIGLSWSWLELVGFGRLLNMLSVIVIPISVIYKVKAKSLTYQY